MKGFNIAPPPASSSTSSLPPVAELIASLQLHNEHSSSHELFGSTISGLLGSTPGLTMRRTYTAHNKEPNQPHAHHGLRGLMFKRNSSRKRRWDSLIEAAKSGRVGRLINRSRSEDSVCNGNNNGHGRLRHSPLSDNNVTDTDSNPSLMEREPTSLGLSMLRHKRRVFSTSRNPKGETGSSLDSKEPTQLKSKLKRASSVPARGTEQEGSIEHQESHEQTQSQQQSVDIQPQTILTPSTTEESVTTANDNSNSDLLKRHNGLVTVLPNLPGIQPVSGHNVSAGWL